jgi:hypothetical protein
MSNVGEDAALALVEAATSRLEHSEALTERYL